MIIEDELTLLSQNQVLNESVAVLIYDTQSTQWELELHIDLDN